MYELVPYKHHFFYEIQSAAVLGFSHQIKGYTTAQRSGGRDSAFVRGIADMEEALFSHHRHPLVMVETLEQKEKGKKKNPADGGGNDVESENGRKLR